MKMLGFPITVENNCKAPGTDFHSLVDVALIVKREEKGKGEGKGEGEEGGEGGEEGQGEEEGEGEERGEGEKTRKVLVEAKSPSVMEKVLLKLQTDSLHISMGSGAPTGESVLNKV